MNLFRCNTLLDEIRLQIGSDSNKAVDCPVVFELDVIMRLGDEWPT